MARAHWHAVAVALAAAALVHPVHAGTNRATAPQETTPGAIRGAVPARPVEQAQAAAKPPNELDAFMARVLERRDETWRKLHDYVLDETEQFRILGPGKVPLHGMKREFTWYVRDGFLIRSPLRFDGVSLGEDERRRYEQRWLEQEKTREQKAAAKRGPAAPSAAPGEQASANADPSLQDFVDQRGEPRFISEAYFLRFKFEPGNYYFAGRDTIDGRPVVKIEYYPTRLFDDHPAQEERTEAREGAKGQAPSAGDERAGKRSREKAKEAGEDAEYARKFNKVALVTLWVDPAEYQIVRYTFENMDFGFLPGRWLVRIDGARASMTMARVLDGVWLPAEIGMDAGLSLANGAYGFDYLRRFSGYKKALTGARIRSMGPGDR